MAIGQTAFITEVRVSDTEQRTNLDLGDTIQVKLGNQAPQTLTVIRAELTSEGGIVYTLGKW